MPGTYSGAGHAKAFVWSRTDHHAVTVISSHAYINVARINRLE